MQTQQNKVVSIGTSYAIDNSEKDMETKGYTINEIMICIAGIALLFVAVTALYAFQRLLSHGHKANSQRSN